MRILAIRGKNLASLAAEFEVDFRKDPLASAGLYTICGPTGSGKSTLLDALSVTLYDKTPRLARASVRGVSLPDVADDTIAPHDPRTLLRRGAAEGFAEVDFIANDNLEYRARWSVRRSRGKAAGKLQNVEISLVKVADQQPIGNLKTEVLEAIQVRLGLTFEQFTRAVLLAQNEFFAFLKADDNSRAELLETLTGTDTYTGISKRAFERAKTEADVLARLRQKLEDQKPLEAEERQKLELENKDAVAAYEGMEKNKAAWEKHLNWYIELEKLKTDEQQAHQDTEASLNKKKAAEPRRIEFVRIEHVQNAKPLVAELDRFIADVNNCNKYLSTVQQQLDSANKAHQDEFSNLKKAEIAVAESEQAKNNAIEDLGKARSLDTRIATLQPLVDQAEKELQTSQAAETTAKTDLAAKQDVLKAETQRLDDLSEWFAKNNKLQPLAETWPKWDTLFDQAGETLTELNEATKVLTTAKEVERSKTTAANNAAAALEKAVIEFQAAETQYAATDQALASYDVEAMVSERRRVEDRRDQLSVAEPVWQRLVGKQLLKAEGERKTEEQKSAIKVAETALEEALRQKPIYDAALKQAERSLERAQLACGENAENMRSALADGAPCPVCGSTNHPYVTNDPHYRSILSGLQLDVDECRKNMVAVERQETSSRTLIEKGREQLSSYEKEDRDLTSQIQTANATWIACSVTAELVGAETKSYLEWFEEQKRIASNQIASLDIAEKSYRTAVTARDEAQVKLNNIRSQYQAAQQDDSAAKVAKGQAGTAAKVAAEKADKDAVRLDAALADLNAVMSERGWMKAWEADTEGFHQRQKGSAELWLKNSREAEQLRTGISKLQIEIKGLNNSYVKAVEALRKQEGTHQNIKGELSTSKNARQTFFAGQSADDVESAFIQAIEIAKRKQQAQNESLQKTLAEQARALEAYTQTRKNLEAQERQMHNAEKLLDVWIEEYNSSRRDKDVLNIDRIRELVAYDGVWIAKERAELQKLEDAIERTKAVLKERKEKREKQEQERPTKETLVAIQAALESLAVNLKETKTRATELTIKLRQDDECIVRSGEVLAEIQKQADKERIWAQLSELIGSADGKRFRNYAQQFTLDVLIGYANRHLVDLSHRYRLERVKESLSLLIVDQDMGDERRSVHSLSGGESFLVSLALALGLASLSSNRVRVESLFIDEGFGSLDAETLMVAMDALDNLQSLGRKVGVISHVQEMTERIGTQIQVKRMSGGQSRIVVVSV